MQSWEYEINDVLIITLKGAEVPARVAGYYDSLDNRTPLYVNLRIADGQAWGRRHVKIFPEQIVRADPEFEARIISEHEASIKQAADEIYAKMSTLQKKQLRDLAKRRQGRSPIEIMIDKACGLE